MVSYDGAVAEVPHVLLYGHVGPRRRLEEARAEADRLVHVSHEGRGRHDRHGYELGEALVELGRRHGYLYKVLLGAADKPALVVDGVVDEVPAGVLVDHRRVAARGVDHRAVANVEEHVAARGSCK